MNQQCLKTLTIYSSPKLWGYYDGPNTAWMGVRGIQIKFCCVIHCEGKTPKGKLIFQKIYCGTGPGLCTFILEALNLQVLFYTKAFSIHIAPTKLINVNNPCNLCNWVPSYCVQNVITLTSVLKIQVFWNMMSCQSARSSLCFKDHNAIIIRV